MNKTELAQWVLEVHGVKPQTFDHPAAKQAAIGHDGLWWAVINVEAPEWQEPDSVWPRKADAAERAAALGPYWRAVPAVAALWMRNEMPPENGAHAALKKAGVL
jgi:hypothetical protein